MYHASTNRDFVNTNSVASGSFTPLSLSPVSFYDFNDQDQITFASTKIASINDKGSGQIAMAQGTDARRPVFNVSGGFNNRSYAAFTGAAVTFLLGAGAVTFIGNSGTTFSYAARFKAAAQARGCLLGRSSGINPDTWLSSGDTGNTSKLMLWVNDTVGGSGAGAISNATPYDNSWHSVVGVYNAGVFTQYIDGVLDTASPQTLQPASMPTPYSQTFTIGCVNSASPVLLLTGSVEYVALYDKALTAANALSLSNYAA